MGQFNYRDYYNSLPEQEQVAIMQRSGGDRNAFDLEIEKHFMDQGYQNHDLQFQVPEEQGEDLYPDKWEYLPEGQGFAQEAYLHP